jgi:predicted peptidase
MLIFVVIITVMVAYFIMKKNHISFGMLYRSIIMNSSVYKNGEHQLLYRLYKPFLRAENQKLPLVLVLHSSPRRGNDNFKQLSGDISQFVSRGFQKIEKTFVLAPQCPENMLWISIEPSAGPYINYKMEVQKQSWRETLIIELIDKLVDKYNIDPQRVYIMGRSMGADGVWDMLYRFPDTFAGAIILNGRTDPSQASRIAKTPIRYFHGEKDTITPVSNALQMRDTLKQYKSDNELEILDTGHGIHFEIYNHELFHWLLSQRKKRALDQEVLEK